MPSTINNKKKTIEYKLCRKIKGTLEESRQVFLTSFHHQYKDFHPICDLGLEQPKSIQGKSNLSDYDKKMVVDNFLNEAFEEEINRFDNTLAGPIDMSSTSCTCDGDSQTQKVEYFFEIMAISTSDDEEGIQVVGYCSIRYDPTKYHYYIHQLAILPSHQGNGLGQLLVFSLLHDYFYFEEDSKSFTIGPKKEKVQASSISILTRRINQKAIEFYQHLGFKEVSEMSETQDDFLDFSKYIQLEKKDLSMNDAG